MKDKKQPPAQSRPLLMRKRRILEILPSELSSWDCGSSVDGSQASTIDPSSDAHSSNATPSIYGSPVIEKKNIGVGDAEKVCFGTVGTFYKRSVCHELL